MRYSLSVVGNGWPWSSSKWARLKLSREPKLRWARRGAFFPRNFWQVPRLLSIQVSYNAIKCVPWTLFHCRCCKLHAPQSRGCVASTCQHVVLCAVPTRGNFALGDLCLYLMDFQICFRVGRKPDVFWMPVCTCFIIPSIITSHGQSSWPLLRRNDRELSGETEDPYDRLATLIST